MKNEQKLATERIILNQHAAFTTERQITSNAEQKSIMREWKAEGAAAYKERKEERIVTLAAETVGAKLDEGTGIRSSNREEEERPLLAIQRFPQQVAKNSSDKTSARKPLKFTSLSPIDNTPKNIYPRITMGSIGEETWENRVHKKPW